MSKNLKYSIIFMATIVTIATSIGVGLFINGLPKNQPFEGEYILRDFTINGETFSEKDFIIQKTSTGDNNSIFVVEKNNDKINFRIHYIYNRVIDTATYNLLIASGDFQNAEDIKTFIRNMVYEHVFILGGTYLTIEKAEDGGYHSDNEGGLTVILNQENNNVKFTDASGNISHEYTWRQKGGWLFQKEYKFNYRGGLIDDETGFGWAYKEAVEFDVSYNLQRK
ncbi:MAG: hypothetical protein LBG88_04295 [Christensenellaceae bacterium]|jgi:hypothetical protein|nr:hypothetical protein [Christensenellaceae bacterium]